jgi:hypothetical protein
MEDRNMTTNTTTTTTEHPFLDDPEAMGMLRFLIHHAAKTPRDVLDRLQELSTTEAADKAAKAKVLAHYAEVDRPQTYKQFDAWQNTSGDDDGDYLTATRTTELWRGNYALRVHIADGTSVDEAARLLKKIRRWIENGALQGAQPTGDVMDLPFE